MSTCPIPFNQLYVHSSGEVYPCSFLQNNPEFILGNIQTSSLADIWKSEQLDKIRKQHLSQLPLSCEKYQASYSCHKTGLRPDFDFTSLTIKRLDLMLDSACNLTCQMCTNIYDRTGGFKDSFFWANNEETLASITELEVVGGEPLISPHYYRLVSLVSSINSKVEWRITTNAHYQITSELIKSFQAIRLKRISISLDSLKPAVFEAIRARSKFETVFDNIVQIKSLVPTVQINMVVQEANYDELVEMLLWTRKNGYKFYPILLVHPRKGSLLERPLAVNKAFILDLMEKNESIKSAELFFFAKKMIDHLALKNDPDVVEPYYNQLQMIGRIGDAF